MKLICYATRTVVLLVPLLFILSGCDVPSALAGKLLPNDSIKPKYTGLKGESIGVLIWTDRGLQIDYPSLNLDLANSIQKQLVGAGDSAELKGSIFPVQPASIARYVLDHPNFDVKDVTEIAPKFGVSRLIYIEVDDFGTRAPRRSNFFAATWRPRCGLSRSTATAPRSSTWRTICVSHSPRKSPKMAHPTVMTFASMAARSMRWPRKSSITWYPMRRRTRSENRESKTEDGR